MTPEWCFRLETFSRWCLSFPHFTLALSQTPSWFRGSCTCLHDCTAHIRGQPAVSIKSAWTWIFTAFLRESANCIVCSIASSKGWRATLSSLLPCPAGKTAAKYEKLPVAQRIDRRLEPALKHA